MNRNKPLYIFSLILMLSGMAEKLYAQVNQDSTSGTTIYIDNADNIVGEFIQEKLVRHLKGNIQVIYDSTFFYCDSATIYDTELFAYGNVVILQTDTTTIFSDSLYFNSDSSRAILNGRVLLKHQDKQLRTSVLEYQVDKKLAYYENTGQLLQDSTVLKSKTGLYDIRRDLIHFREQVSVVDSSFRLRADSLKYDTRLKKVLFTGPTIILQDTARIFCESGYYDIDRNNASFQSNPLYLEPDKSARARVIEYLSEDELILLAGNAHYRDTEQDVRADTIRYYRQKEKSILLGRVRVTGRDNTITGEYIEYFNETGDFISRGRTTLEEEATRLTADLIDLSEEAGQGMAFGNVILEDSVARMEILCDLLYTYDDNSRFKAYNDSLSRPLLKKFMDRDTLYLSADTLYAYEMVVDQDTFQLINAYYNVRIFQNDFQAVSDSLSYHSKDSSFVLFHDPVMWSDSTQFSGDTISIFLADEKIDQLFLRPNGLIVNQETGNLYNQIIGKRIHAYFRNDSLDQLHALGNTESLYYLKDESDRFIGAVKTICSSMIFTFRDSDIHDIKYYEDPVSSTSPMKKELNSPQRLKGFKWLIGQKPLDRHVDRIQVIHGKTRSPVIKTETETIETDKSTSDEEQQEN